MIWKIIIVALCVVFFMCAIYFKKVNEWFYRKGFEAGIDFSVGYFNALTEKEIDAEELK